MGAFAVEDKQQQWHNACSKDNKKMKAFVDAWRAHYLSYN